MRYWAASARFGADTAYDVAQMQIGRRLAMKLLNASKFALAQGVHAGLVGRAELVTEPLDRALLTSLRTTVGACGTHMAAYDYAHMLRAAESFFWEFTDDYVELVKDRSYGADGEAAQLSAHATLATALDVLLRLFAPITPFVTEEVWSWWQEGSVHRAAWPTAEALPEFSAAEAPEGMLADVAAVLGEVRRSKTEAKVSQKTEIAHAVVTAEEPIIELIRLAETDLRAAGRVRDWELTSTPDSGITVSDVEFVEADPQH